MENMQSKTIVERSVLCLSDVLTGRKCNNDEQASQIDNYQVMAWLESELVMCPCLIIRRQ